MAGFQVKLSGEWKDYDKTENKILKRAYLAGFDNAKYRLRGQQYEVDFKHMKQKNVRSGKTRDIRPPHKWERPPAPIVPAGSTFCIKVPPGSPGTTIQVPHPKNKACMIAVNVPPTAKVGAAMLVPVPPLPDEVSGGGGGGGGGGGAPAEKEGGGGWSTGAKVAAGGAAVVALGGAAVGGAVLGEHIADIGGWDAAMEDLGDVAADAGDAIGDAAEDAGEAIAGAAEDAGEWIAGASEDVGDFVMDLF